MNVVNKVAASQQPAALPAVNAHLAKLLIVWPLDVLGPLPLLGEYAAKTCNTQLRPGHCGRLPAALAE